MDEQVKATPESARPAGRARLRRRPPVRIGALIALAAAAGFITWLAVRGDDDSTPQLPRTAAVAGSQPGAAAVAMSVPRLKKLQAALKHPIYWAGPRRGFKYEVTQRRDGAVYVRYLPPRVRVGDPRGAFLIVVTYPYANALLAIKRVENGKGIRVPGGGLALVHQGYPKSVHMAYPRVNYQIEVYDASPRVARRVATSGQVRPVG
jgi:hypothetical protein